MIGSVHLASSVKDRRAFPEPSSEIGSDLFQLGHNFCDREHVKKYFIEHCEEFAEVFKGRPDKVNLRGIRINHAFAIYMIAKKLQPQAIIESGVNAGQSTYMFRKAAPRAKIISLDPMNASDVGQAPRWIDDTNNDYLTGSNFKDIENVDWKNYAGIDITSTLVFIDDHQRSYSRIKHLHPLGFKHFIIEDNYALFRGASMREIGHSPKTILLGRGRDMSRALWLTENLESYHEIPPLFFGYNSLPDRHKKNRLLGHHLLQGNFSTLYVYAAPLFRTDLHEDDLRVAEKFRDLIGFNFKKDYDDFMCYNHIAYLKMK